MLNIDLFQVIDEGNVTLHPTMMEIEAFKAILTRENHKKIFAYIYHTSDPKSPYFRLAPNYREEVVIEDLGLGEDWEPDREVIKAQEKYRHLKKSIFTTLLESAFTAIHAMTEYLSTVDFNEIDATGRYVHDVNKIMTALQKIGGVVDSLKTVQEQIEKEEDSTTVRGGVKLSKWNE